MSSTDLQSLMSLLGNAGLRFYHRLIRTLTLPSNATPTDPRLVIGPDVPTELQTWVGTNFSQHCYFAMLGYDVTGGYLFDAYCYSDAIQVAQKISGYVEGAGAPFPGRFHLFHIEGWNIPSGLSSYSIGASTLAGETLRVYSLMNHITTTGGGETQVDGFSLSRGNRGANTNLVALGPSGVGTEFLVFGSQPFDRVQGRAYRIRLFAWCTHSVVGAFDVRIRDGVNVAGTLFKSFRVYNLTAGVDSVVMLETVLQHTAATVTGSRICWTFQSISGGTVTMVAVASKFPEFEVTDAGDTTEFTNMEVF